MFAFDHLIHSRRPFVSFLRSLSCLMPLACLAIAPAKGADRDRVDAQAPPGQVVLQHTRGGAFFISEPLKEEYDRLLARTRALQADLDADRITGAQAQAELRTLREQLDALRKTIDEKKVLVSPVKLHQQTQTTEFALGPAKLLVITADSIRVEGWNGPGVRCVIEKTVLAADDEPVDAHLDAIKVVHHHGPAPDVVGEPVTRRQAEEQQFLDSPDGRKLSDQARQMRQKIFQSVTDAHALFSAFQGKAIDTIELQGLTFEQGNRQITIGIKSPRGGSSLGSDWQRHAALTVYVPASTAVALRGCEVGLDVKGVKAALLLSTAGSHDRDYNGAFAIRDVDGPVTINNAPLDLLENIHGNVIIRSTIEMVNTGSQHDRGQRTLYTPPPRTLICRNIQGDLVARFTRSDLQVQAVSGLIDISNEFGRTSLTLTGPLPARPHRILAEAGTIDMRMPATALGKLPFQALTNCGTLRTNASQAILEDTAFTLGDDPTGSPRNWRGLKTKPSDPGSFFADADRLGAVLKDQDRSPGLDLISRGGSIHVAIEP